MTLQTTFFTVIEQFFNWYHREGRSLPWREQPEPYPVFLSEVILQQTRVEQGLAYFHRFMDTFPTVQDLANATEEEVLKLWQGLGYYSRARNLHKAAKHLMEIHQGIFPSNFNELIKIPGVGPYTARAILAFAFSKPEVAADGNIWRVTSRFFGLNNEFPSKKTMELTQELWKDWVVQQPSVFNNAMMDLGSGICTPKQPKCEQCPLQSQCFSFPSGAWVNLPFKEKKTKVKPLTLVYLISKSDGKVLMKKRTENTIWANMYDFPEITFPSHWDSEMDIQEEISKNSRVRTVHSVAKQSFHLLSHRKIQPFFCFVDFVPILQLEREEKWIPLEQIHELPVPKIIESLIATF
ncbi:MAG: A/G-specific adenine glycosylase [Flavobacteriia bacterium]|nr:A/G-specific adenine glycosylase [Flavobacteriia bacterium]